MKTSRKTRFLSLVLALALSVSLRPAAGADRVDFPDVPGNHWACDSIRDCFERGIVRGYDDGRFHPDDPVTGYQFIAMITRMFCSDLVETYGQQIPADSKWYTAYGMAAASLGFDRDVTLTDTPMSRYDMAAVLNNIVNEKNIILKVVHRHNAIEGKEPLPMDWPRALQEAAMESIRDWDGIPGQYGRAVSMCYALGALTGMSDGTFSGGQTMTRAQACAVITRMKDLNEGKMLSRSEPPARPETPEQIGAGLLANGQEATVENVQAVLDEIRKSCPNNTVWGPTTAYMPSDEVHKALIHHGFRASTAGGCGGWASMVSDTVFGTSGAPGREVTDTNEIRPGDLVICLNNKGETLHACVVTKVEMTTNRITNKPVTLVHTCDGNVNGGYVQWDIARPIIGLGVGNNTGYTTCYRVVTRYPD